MQSIFYSLFPKKQAWCEGKKAFVLLSTDYSNLGDHAMTYAHIKFLHETLPSYHIYEILVGDTIKLLKSIRKIINKDDLITLKGGGNIGVEYFREELIRRKIIKMFPDVKIIMFPQTVYFPDTKLGKKQFYETVGIFNSHNNFHAFFRDKISYDIIASKLTCYTYIIPDIAFSLGDIKIHNQSRHGAVTCLRNDVEGIYSEKDKEHIYATLRNLFKDDVLCTDTIRDYKIEIPDRKKELYAIWKIIGNAQVLITDRLHGMVFAVLLGTPCVVLNTYNHKLRAQYDWIKNLKGVQCIDLGVDNLQTAIMTVCNELAPKISKEYFNSYFDILRCCVKGEIS